MLGCIAGIKHQAHPCWQYHYSKGIKKEHRRRDREGEGERNWHKNGNRNVNRDGNRNADGDGNGNRNENGNGTRDFNENGDERVRLVEKEGAL